MLSGGAFDVTVGPLVDAYGFGSGKERALDAETLDALKSQIGFQLIEYLPEAAGISKMVPELRVDLSAVAKGYGVDALVDVIKEHGIKHAMVEIGGEVRAFGLNSRAIPWRIGIERPEVIAGGKQRVVGLSEESMATSGDYRNFKIDASGRRISHTIDPRSGRPVEHGLASVTVIRPTCAEADALDRRCPWPRGRMRLAGKGWKVLMLIRDGDAIVESMSAAFQQHIDGEQS